MARLSTDSSDVELICSLRSGSKQALGVLYDRYGRLVYTVALRILKQPSDAEDLTQEIFLNFWNQEKFDPKRATISTYLCVMVRSLALNRLASHGSYQRSLKRLQLLSLEELSSTTPLEKASLIEQQEAVQQALAQLSDQQRQILEMNFYQGLSHSQISQQLDIPLGTVKTKVRKGLMKLRQQLGNAVHEG
jgi:RNA polymerase sigma-70 factor, ECF subfamily